MPVYVASMDEGVIVFDGPEDEPPPLIADEQEEDDEDHNIAVEELGEEDVQMPHLEQGEEEFHMQQPPPELHNADIFHHFIHEQETMEDPAAHADHHDNHHPAFFDNVHQINFEGIANLNHWLLGHHHQHTQNMATIANNHHQHSLEDESMPQLDMDELAIFPPLPLYGVLPADMVTLFHATGPQMHSVQLRALKKRFQQIRERKPSYWQRVAVGMYKRSLRGAAGGCDVRFIVECKYPSSAPQYLYGHKFILASNAVFRQLFGYRKLEDSLMDDHSDGHLTDIDLPTISIEGMRLIILTAYDLKVAKLSLEDALYMQYWAPRFCMDSLAKYCNSVICKRPFR